MFIFRNVSKVLAEPTYYEVSKEEWNYLFFATNDYTVCKNLDDYWVWMKSQPVEIDLS